MILQSVTFFPLLDCLSGLAWLFIPQRPELPFSTWKWGNMQVKPDMSRWWKTGKDNIYLELAHSKHNYSDIHCQVTKGQPELTLVFKPTQSVRQFLCSRFVCQYNICVAKKEPKLIPNKTKNQSTKDLYGPTVYKSPNKTNEMYLNFTLPSLEHSSNTVEKVAHSKNIYKKTHPPPPKKFQA